MTTRLKRLPPPSAEAPPLSMAVFRERLTAEPTLCDAWVRVAALGRLGSGTLEPVYELADPLAERDQPTIEAKLSWASFRRIDRKLDGFGRDRWIGYDVVLWLAATEGGIEILDLAPASVEQLLAIFEREVRRMMADLGSLAGQHRLAEPARAEVVDVLHWPGDPSWPVAKERLDRLTQGGVVWHPVKMNLAGPPGARAVATYLMDRIEHPERAPDAILIVAADAPGRRFPFLTDIEVSMFAGAIEVPIVLAVEANASHLHAVVFASADDPLAGVERLERLVDDARVHATRTRRLEDYLRRPELPDD